MGETKEKITPKVSVVIPVYNTECFVKETVISILSQTLKDIEVILIDDGSIDKSKTVMEKIAENDRRILLISQPNQGLSATRNTGLKLAQGDFIYFMDSDDVLESDALSECYQKCILEQLDFVFFNADILKGGGNSESFNYTRNVMNPEKIYLGIDALKEQVNASEFRSSVCLNFISREYLQKIKLNFYPNILHEDQLFTFLLYADAKRVGYIDKTFFHRRVRSDSIMTRNFTMKNMNGYFTVSAQLSQRKKLMAQEREIIELFLSQILNAAVWNAHKMPLKDRLKTFFLSFYRYRKVVSCRTLAVLLFKKYF